MIDALSGRGWEAPRADPQAEYARRRDERARPVVFLAGVGLGV